MELNKKKNHNPSEQEVTTQKGTLIKHAEYYKYVRNLVVLNNIPGVSTTAICLTITLLLLQ